MTLNRAIQLTLIIKTATQELSYWSRDAHANSQGFHRVSQLCKTVHDSVEQFNQAGVSIVYLRKQIPLLKAMQKEFCGINN